MGCGASTPAVTDSPAGFREAPNTASGNVPEEGTSELTNPLIDNVLMSRTPTIDDVARTTDASLLTTGVTLAFLLDLPKLAKLPEKFPEGEFLQ